MEIGFSQMNRPAALGISKCNCRVNMSQKLQTIVPFHLFLIAFLYRSKMEKACGLWKLFFLLIAG